jgi:hypothetical protein
MKENSPMQSRQVINLAAVLLALAMLIFFSSYRVSAQDPATETPADGFTETPTEIATATFTQTATGAPMPSASPTLSPGDCGLITFTSPGFRKTTSGGKPVIYVYVKNATAADIYLSGFSFDWTIYQGLTLGQVFRRWSMGTQDASFYTSQSSYFWASNVGPVIPAGQTVALRFYFNNVDANWANIDPKMFGLSAEFNQACTINLPMMPTSTPTSTRIVTKTSTVTPTASITYTHTPFITETPTSTLTITPTRTNTRTPTASVTPTRTVTVTQTKTITPTRTTTCTPTKTPTITPTRTVTRTVPPPSHTPTVTMTETSTETETPFATETSTPDGSPSPTDTPTDEVTPVLPPTETQTITPTRTPTRTTTPTITPIRTTTPTPTDSDIGYIYPQGIYS